MGLFKRDRQEPAEGESADEGRSPAADRPALARQWRKQGTLPCASCGATMTLPAGADQVACAFCQARVERAGLR
jgi:LSD1 subclass zinc finger protein